MLIYYNPEKAAKDLVEANDYISSLYNDLLVGDLKDYRTKDYENTLYYNKASTYN